MFKGFLFAALACLLWGTHYVIPNFAPGFSTQEILFGRYLVFGIFSLLLALIKRKRSEFDFKTLPPLKMILTLAFLGFFTYDLLEIVNVRFHGSEAVALIYGFVLLTSSIGIRIIAQKRMPDRADWLNMLLPLCGLLVLEWEILDSLFEGDWIICWGLAIFQACLWVFYTREMAASTRGFEKPEGVAGNITIMIGLTCLVLSAFGWAFYILMTDIPTAAYFRTHSSAEWVSFLGTSLLSGIGINWLATHLWCVASVRVPYKLLSCLLLGDVVFAKIYELFLYENAFSFFHLSGIFILLGSGLLISWLGADYSEDPSTADIQANVRDPHSEESLPAFIEVPVPVYEV